MQFETDDHFHTYVFEESSHLQYEIAGEWDGPDTQEIPEEAITGWAVTRLIWDHRVPKN